MTASVPAAVDRMASHLTVPFARGADRLDLAFAPGSTTGHGVLAGYTFAEHRARFGVDPKPRYVVRALRAVPAATTLSIRYQVPGTGPRSADVPVPAGTRPGTSFAIPLGADTATAALTSVDVAPAGEVPVAGSWRITALLGDLAALLWALGTERDALTGQLAVVRGQRTLAEATGASLDLIGADLGVRRLPPLPYAFEPDTVALYPLDEPAGASQVADAMALYRGGRGHPGTVAGALLGAVGRFGTGARFADPAEITVPDHADFAVPRTADLTVECFLRPDGPDTAAPVLTKLADAPGAAGWALSIGAFGRGIPNNLRFQVFDGTQRITLFADLTLRGDRFQHVAGVIDRSDQRALLYVDGELRASRSITELGALTSTDPLRIGRAGDNRSAALSGVVDEVRIGRVARRAFHPVLGESDDSYRLRLAIFRRWLLPSPANLQQDVNRVSGPVAGVAEPFVLTDTEPPLVAGSRAIMIRPTRLGPDESIDALGRRGTDEATASGRAEDDTNFDPLLLGGIADLNPLLIRTNSEFRTRSSTRTALRTLLDLLAKEADAAGQLVVTSGFEPTAGDLRRVGRAVVLSHTGIAPDRLGALAHRAGFSWVRHRAATADVYASVAGTTSLELVVGEDGDTPLPGIDLFVDRPAELTLNPPPPPGARLRWSVLHHENGRAELVSRDDDPVCRLRPTTPGRLVVTIEASRFGHTVTGSRVLRVGHAILPLGVGVTEDGRTGVDESVAGAPGEFPFLPSYPLLFFDSRLEPPTNRDCRVHPVLHEPLRRFLTLVEADGFAGTPLRLASGWRPESTGLEAVGAAITLEPTRSGVPMARLGTLAYASGFGFVRANAGTLRLAHRPATPVLFHEPSGSNGLPADVRDVDEGSQIRIGLTPAAWGSGAVLAGNLVCLMNVGTSTVTVLDPATGTVLRGAPTGLLPSAIAVSPDNAKVFTAHFATRSLSVISVAGGQVVDTIPLTPVEQRLGLAHRPDRPELLLLTEVGLLAINTSTKAVRATATVATSAAPAIRMAMEPDGTRVWVGAGDATVRAVSVDPMTLSSVVTLPSIPVDVAVTAASVLVTVESGLLCVVDKATGKVTTFADVGKKPTALAVDAAAGTLYVADEAGSRIVARKLDGTPSTQPPVPIADRISSLIAAPGRLYFTTTANPPMGSSVLVGATTAGVVVPTQPHAAPVLWPIGTGFGERLAWTAQTGADARAVLRDTHTHEVRLIAERAGPVLLSARFLRRDRLPFTVRVDLHHDLVTREKAGEKVVVRREQYERIMNVLSESHPLGVEIDTRVLREHVLELGPGAGSIGPTDTFPKYRTDQRRSPRRAAGS